MVLTDGCGCCSLQWNEFFIFDCGSVGESATLTCSLWDKDLLGKDDLMGSFTFDAGDLVAGDPPKDVWLESKQSSLHSRPVCVVGWVDIQ